MPEYLFNTTVLSNFAAAGRLDLLAERYRGLAFTTVEVGDELRKGVKAGYAYLEAILEQLEPVDSAGWLRILAPESATEHRLRSEYDHFLDPGEASCLALAIARGLTFVSDDLAARRLAEANGVPLTGTLGILIRLVREGALPLNEANAMLSAMIERCYRSPVDRLDDLV
jgi:predicted nucleic acid-binding protein